MIGLPSTECTDIILGAPFPSGEYLSLVPVLAQDVPQEFFKKRHLVRPRLVWLS